MTPAGQRAPDLAERLGAAVDYLEAHLARGARLEAAARRAGFSRWHFIRVFQAACGVPPAEYVRRRRLSRAAATLAAGEAVAAVALDCGYSSQAAFTRAFSRAFGVPPAAWRRRARGGGAELRLTPLFEPRLPWPLEPLPPPRWEERGPSRWVGLATRAPNRRFQAFADLPAFWEDWLANERWRAVQGIVPFDRGHSLVRAHPDGEVEYVIAVEVPPGAAAPRGYRAMEVPGGLFAVFERQGEPARTLQSLALGVYCEWMPEAGVGRRPGAWDLERYHLLPGAPPGHLRCELWVPVERRARPRAPADG